MFSNIRVSDLLRETAGKLISDLGGDPVFTTISTDTRTVKKGDVFVAIKGENFDGHGFIQEAVTKGAVAVLSEKVVEVSVPLIQVDQSVVAMARFARSLRRRFKGPVFAITGSAGKSSTKEALATALGTNTLASPASFNNLLGVSKTLCLVEDATQRMVLEMGMNGFGEIKEMCEFFNPTCGLITNIGDAHVGKLGGKDGIYRAKKELFGYLKMQKETLGVVVNLDDSNVVKAFEECDLSKDRAVTYSWKSGAKADVRVINAAMDRGTGHLQLNFDIRGQRADLTLGVYGLHFASNIAAAIAAALLLGENTSDILQRLTTFEPASHRGHILQLNGLRTLIDESYNSNPTALAASLHSFSQFDSARKRLFVIGEMKELGSFSQSLHFDAGKVFCDYAKESSFELFAVGEEMKSFVRAVEERLPKNGVWKWFPSGQDALESVISAYSPGAVCLVKGSRGMKLDYVVEKLKVCNAMR